MLVGIPAIGPDHQIAAEVQGCGAEEDFPIISLRIPRAYPGFRHLQCKLAQIQRQLELVAGRHFAKKIEPNLTRGSVSE